MDLCVVYRADATPAFRLRASDRFGPSAFTITTPPDRPLSASAVVDLARRPLRLDARPLRLSLFGVPLRPTEDVAGLLAHLPAGARRRSLFLLTPSPPSPPKPHAEGRKGRTPLPYYADPVQWEPKRGALYHAVMEVCASFTALWGKPDVCVRCRHHIYAHRAKTPTGAGCIVRRVCSPLRTAPREGERPRTSSNRRRDSHPSTPQCHRHSCERFVPLWGNNAYCGDCYLPSAQHRTTVTPREEKKSPSRHRIIKDRHSQEEAEVLVVALASGRSSAFVTPRKMLQYSAPPSTTSTTATTTTTTSIRATTRVTNSLSVASAPRLQGGGCSHLSRSSSSSNTVHHTSMELPWVLVLQFATMEELMVCKNVSRMLRMAALPLLNANWRFILETFDVPVTKREALRSGASSCAATMAKVMCEKGLHDAYAFLRRCTLELVRALRAVEGCVPNEEKRIIEQKVKRCATPSATQVAIAIATKGFAETRSGSGEKYDPWDPMMLDDDAPHSANHNVVLVRDALVTLMERASLCDPTSLSLAALDCIETVFEEIAFAAAVSRVRCSNATRGEVCEVEEEGGQKHPEDAMDKKIKNKCWNDYYPKKRLARFVSLGALLNDYALMPLVEFLAAIEAVARMKRKARRCLRQM